MYNLHVLEEKCFKEIKGLNTFLKGVIGIQVYQLDQVTHKQIIEVL